MDPVAQSEVLKLWKEPCEAVFDFLAVQHPYELAKLVAFGELEPHDLTFATEALGRIGNSTLVRLVLAPLLRHKVPVVREGAIYGLQHHLDEALRSEIRLMAANDLSQGVRMAAADAIT